MIRGVLKWVFLPQVPPSIEAEFDIEGMDVFSVERDGADTMFGYWETRRMGPDVSVQVPETWVVATTDDQHRAFCARLTAKIARREQKANT